MNEATKVPCDTLPSFDMQTFFLGEILDRSIGGRIGQAVCRYRNCVRSVARGAGRGQNTEDDAKNQRISPKAADSFGRSNVLPYCGKCSSAVEALSILTAARSQPGAYGRHAY